MVHTATKTGSKTNRTYVKQLTVWIDGLLVKLSGSTVSATDLVAIAHEINSAPKPSKIARQLYGHPLTEEQAQCFLQAVRHTAQDDPVLARCIALGKLWQVTCQTARQALQCYEVGLAQAILRYLRAQIQSL